MEKGMGIKANFRDKLGTTSHATGTPLKLYVEVLNELGNPVTLSQFSKGVYQILNSKDEVIVEVSTSNNIRSDQHYYTIHVPSEYMHITGSHTHQFMLFDKLNNELPPVFKELLLVK